MIIVTVCCDDCGRELVRGYTVRSSLSGSGYRSDSVPIPELPIDRRNGDRDDRSTVFSVTHADLCARCLRERAATQPARVVQMCRHGLPDCDLCAAAGLPPYQVSR